MSFKISKPGARLSGFTKDEHEDHLLAFVGVTLEEDTDTAYGTSDAARVESVVCLDHPAVYHDQMIFGTALVPRLTETDDDTDIVLGRLVKGDAKPGRNAPWLLEDPVDIDEKRCEEFFEQYANRLKSGRIIVEFISDGEDPDKF